MSVTSHDALPEFPGKLLKIDAPATDVNDSTEDLAGEITSELAPAAAKPAVSAPALPAAGEIDASGHAGPVAGGNVLRDRYVLETPLGSGGTAMVYRAVDLRRDAGAAEGRRVAVKLLRPELRDRPESVARLQREFRQTQAVAHPAVMRFHDLDCDRGTWFIVMELLSGETLGPRLRRAAPDGLSAAEALGIAATIGDALAQAHARGITHGDVKPDNIYVTTSGAVRLLDFGVAPEAPGLAATDEKATQPVAAATRAYASPEVLAGEHAEPRDDVFSLACVTYEMLAGTHPYRRQSREVAARTAAAPRAIASLDAVRWAAVSSALDFKRAARPQMVKLVQALRGEAAAAEATAPAPFPVPLPEAAPPAIPRRSRFLLWSLVAAALAIALALGVRIGRNQPDAVPAAASAPPPSVEAGAPETPTAKEAASLPAATRPRPAVKAAAAPRAEDAVPPNTRPGLVSFDSPMMIVSKRAVVAAIPLRHFSRVRRAAQVTWRIVDGTARAGRDYGGPLNGVENFVEGNTFRILYVPILLDARTTLDRRFAVELTGASPGTELGPTQRIEVTILGTA